MANILVLANETIGGKELLDAIRERAKQGDAHFHVVVPQSRPRERSQVRDVPFVGDSERTLERQDRPVEFSAKLFEASEIQAGPNEAELVIERFSESDSLLAMLASLIEHSEFGEGARQEGACHHCRIRNKAKTIARQLTGQRVN